MVHSHTAPTMRKTNTPPSRQCRDFISAAVFQGLRLTSVQTETSPPSDLLSFFPAGLPYGGVCDASVRGNRRAEHYAASGHQGNSEGRCSYPGSSVPDGPRAFNRQSRGAAGHHPLARPAVHLLRVYELGRCLPLP